MIMTFKSKDENIKAKCNKNVLWMCSNYNITPIQLLIQLDKINYIECIANEIKISFTNDTELLLNGTNKESIIDFNYWLTELLLLDI